MYKLIAVKTKKEREEFLNFPKFIYKKNTRQNKKDETLLLGNKHVLSKYFKFYPFVLKDDKKVVARCAATVYYDNEEEAFLGFYECIKDEKTSMYLLEKVEEFLKQKNIKKIIGPVDASFWIRYRFKINQFNKIPYSGEPYNKEYYKGFWEKSGYNVLNSYSSNIFSKVTTSQLDEKLKNRKNEMIKKGYIIKNATYKEFDKQLKEIYRLLIVLYANFPTFKFITEEEFYNLYKNLKYILNYSMVKLAYKEERMVAFFVCIPNYGNAKLSDIIKIKTKPKEYILMYLGTSNEHPGMGAALTECIVEELCKNGCDSIGALIMDGKISGNYYKKLIKDKYEYVLMEKNLIIQNRF